MRWNHDADVQIACQYRLLKIHVGDHHLKSLLNTVDQGLIFLQQS